MIPLVVPLLGITFNTLNAYINARWLTHFGDYGPEWLYDPRFLIGLALFVAGWLGDKISKKNMIVIFLLTLLLDIKYLL